MFLLWFGLAFDLRETRTRLSNAKHFGNVMKRVVGWSYDGNFDLRKSFPRRRTESYLEVVRCRMGRFAIVDSPTELPGTFGCTIEKHLYSQAPSVPPPPASPAQASESLGKAVAGISNKREKDHDNVTIFNPTLSSKVVNLKFLYVGA